VIGSRPIIGNARTCLTIMSPHGAQVGCGPMTRRKSMLKYKIFGAAVLLSAAVATPALAEVIQEPGAYAFVYPNGDLGLGYSRSANAMAQTMRGDVAGMRMSMPAHRARRASANKHY
jgi:hypothetical protein